jgi:hypothetical protein
MTSRPLTHAFPLPKGWSEYLKSSLLHAISLTAMALTVARGRAAETRGKTHRLQTELERANSEIALLKEDLEVKDDRWSRLPSRRRPRYSPTHRMRILQLKAARGWSYEQAARVLRAGGASSLGR